MNIKKHLAIIVIICFTMNFFNGCYQKKKTDHITLTYVSYYENSDSVEMVNKFNESHSDITIQLEFRDRGLALVNGDFDVIDKLKREIAVGKGPDIIDYSVLYSSSDILGEYTIDLSNYIDSSQIPVIDNLIDAFSYQGKHYVIPTEVSVLSLMVPADSYAGDDTWTVGEMISYYNSFIEKYPDAMLTYGQSKMEIFNIFAMFAMEDFIDWDSRTCFFDGDDFKNLLIFCDRFDDEFFYDSYPSGEECCRNHLVALDCGGFFTEEDIVDKRLYFGNAGVKYIGYPVSEGNGYMVEPCNHMMAISRNCKYPDYAWEFIESFLVEEYQRNVENLPVNQNVLEQTIEESMEVQIDQETGIPIPKYTYAIDGNLPPLEINAMTEEEAEVFRKVVYGADKVASMEYIIVSNLINEEVQSYFAGDKEIDEVCNIIQSRVSIYLEEKE